MRYYFDDTININDLDFNNTLVDKKSCKRFLIYDVVYKTIYGANTLQINLDKVEGYIRTKYK